MSSIRGVNGPASAPAATLARESVRGGVTSGSHFTTGAPHDAREGVGELQGAVIGAEGDAVADDQAVLHQHGRPLRRLRQGVERAGFPSGPAPDSRVGYSAAAPDCLMMGSQKAWSSS